MPMISRPLRIEPLKDLQEFFPFVYQRAHVDVPESVARAVSERLLILLAENLNPFLRNRFVQRFGDLLNTKVDLQLPKNDHGVEEILLELSKIPGSSPHIADDLYGATLEGLWYWLKEEEMEDLILSSPVDLAQDLRAARPGDKRGSY